MDSRARRSSNAGLAETNRADAVAWPRTPEREYHSKERQQQGTTFFHRKQCHSVIHYHESSYFAPEFQIHSLRSLPIRQLQICTPQGPPPRWPPER
jgi:hypothetical protein